MDETAFQAELNKYKIIRQPNYYKSRNRPKVAKSTASSNSGISTNVIAKEVVSSNIINSNESNFWELFSAANSSILTTAESIKFIEALKKEHADTIRGKVNLHDLDVIAGSILK